MAKKANVEGHARRAKKLSMSRLVDRLGELRDQRLPIEEEEAAYKHEFIERYLADPEHRSMRSGINYEAEYSEVVQMIVDQEECARKLKCAVAALPRKKSRQRKVDVRLRAGVVLQLVTVTKQAAG